LKVAPIDAESWRNRLVRELDSAVVGFDRGARQNRVEVMEQVGRLVGDSLTYTTLLILERMNEGATARMAELASSVGVTCATITRQIQDLERKGLILRTQDDQDGRVSIVGLTEAGSRLAEVASEARRNLLGQALANWSDDDLGEMSRFFRRLEDDMLRFWTAQTSVFTTVEQR
jgi:DNA-binding MarR family transcriptional regulator